MKKSMIEVAYQVLTNNDGAMPFVDLWKDVSQEMGFSQTQFEDNIAQFYTDLSLDGRFLNMSQNTWDLRSRHTYSESRKRNGRRKRIKRILFHNKFTLNC